MSEAGLNGIDMQAVFAAWIIANNGCAQSPEISCSGEGGYFKGTECPMLDCYGLCSAGCLDSVRQWLEKYHQQKAEAAEAEKRKAEAAKKEEQETKKTCGNCQYTPESTTYKNVKPCEKKNTNVPVSSPGCPDFEPRVAADQSGSSFSAGGADTAAYAERITQLEKENARLAEEIGEYKGVTRRISEICEVIVIGIDQAVKEREELQNQLNTAQERILQLERWDSDLAAKCERITEQRNKLSNDLIEATRRVKEVEQENIGLRLRGRYEQLQKESFQPRERKQVWSWPTHYYSTGTGVSVSDFLAILERSR